MKTVVIEKPGQLTLQERPLPVPTAGEVRIKVNYASICGSDVHIRHGHNPFARYPRVIGHEFFGTVDAVGEGIGTDRIGERVAVDPVVSCGHCYPCSVGRPNVCSQLQVLGVHRDGGFSEYAVVPAANAYLLPESIPDRLACLVEPFTIAANICAFLRPQPADVALIYGAGPMGLTAIQVLKGVYDLRRVIVTDRLPERLAMAKESGADVMLDNSKVPLSAQLEGEQPTLIIDAACHPAILAEAVALASPAARIGLLGFSGEPCTLTQQSLTSKELSLFTSRLNSHRFPQVIDWMTGKLIQPEKLVTHSMPLRDIDAAMTLFEKDPRSCCKVILTLD
ncbi:Zn-dependent oxidoreductase [Erwinia psidii]|uniref:Zn-dependent oxidoreductase n=1 Tax=Erwinia psidii TaxID=69224 RepID=A0A3N6S2G5_9GAMM|nr:Zn-dependent oxidoreductase [Erwinia psidii]MCX8962332.1 Zn-dependent oxidoreductase [Erwinia psidii]RQM39818.1 Zn-dependent oxidoreductase [Erwinia psidii]